MGAPTLSKSDYLKGLQCPKALWFQFHRKDLCPTWESSTKIDAGIEAGKLARDLYPGGILVNKVPLAPSVAVKETQALIAEGHEILYEASALSPDGGYAKIDILTKLPSGWHLIEVKSSTSAKGYHIDDLALQYHVFQSAGYEIRRCSLVLVNNQYVRQGNLNIPQLFCLEDVTEAVKQRQTQVAETIPRLRQLTAKQEEPEVAIGPQCDNPFECEYKKHCWQDVPEYSVFNVVSKKKAAEIAKETGSYRVEDLPASHLPKSGAKVIDLEVYRSGEAVIDRNAIGAFMEKLQYPLYYVDYETVGHPIPLFEHMRPYQNIPFQFSLHIQETPGSQLQNMQFLHCYRTDPREEFCERLVELLGEAGSVIVYNQSFEESCNNDLAAVFPQYNERIAAINARMVDLLIPFRKRWVYHPAQKGSASIKAVLPAFTDLAHEALAISNGEEASERYLHFLMHGLPKEEQEKLWADLTAYCELDTFAMFKLVEVLRERI